ncbi:unnamed protein product [Ambrosiozyma monospora]|uniref:Unnamed protein product n=1 Tax=Ambrosiozyma monospora TaxID=43982 RepID=A0A9W6YY89_AMBMO|nr:unnamed protein product [Ambrosiozyma monospora]
MGIPQASPISSILYLIYSSPIFTESKINEKVTLSGFVDDLNLYITGDDFEANKKAPEDAYGAIIEKGAYLNIGHLILETNCIPYTSKISHMKLLNPTLIDINRI